MSLAPPPPGSNLSTMLKYIQVVKYNLTGESVCVLARKDGAGQKKKRGQLNHL